MDSAKTILLEMDFDLANINMESFGATRSDAGGSETEAKPGHIKIDFARSGKQVSTDGNMTLLEFAEAHEIEVDYSCRSGSCGECKMKLIKGKVHSETSDGLDKEEEKEGYFLSCVSLPTENCSFDI